MSKITDALISAIIKKGVLYEARNIILDIDIPLENAEKTTVKIHIDHITAKVDTDD